MLFKDIPDGACIIWLGTTYVKEEGDLRSTQNDIAVLTETLFDPRRTHFVWNETANSYTKRASFIDRFLATLLVVIAVIFFLCLAFSGR